jgi:hypothetical protein
MPVFIFVSIDMQCNYYVIREGMANVEGKKMER